jgi:protein required for attachment to host cells
MKNVWILVADEAIARLLEQPEEGGDLVPVEALTDPDAHASEADMQHSPHGRRAGGGTVGHATVSASDSERHQHAQVFAGQIAAHLLARHREGRYGRLHVVAAPRMLGYLRKALERDLADVVASTLDKDVVHETPAQLTERLAEALRPVPRPEI